MGTAAVFDLTPADTGDYLREEYVIGEIRNPSYNRLAADQEYLNKTMPSMPPKSSADSDLMEEFYAECDDYLVEIRRGVLKLDEQVGQVSLDGDAVERIFRSFHTLKGICGMAGLQQAEQLAHRAEDYLRALMRQEAVLSESGLDILNAVAQTLEQLVVAHRQGQSGSDIRPLLERISALTRSSGGSAESQAPLEHAAADSTLLARVQAARQQGKEVFRALFRPSPELDQRGVNVGFIRSELQAIGEILSAAPKVQSGGELVFEFVIAASVQPDDPGRLANDGLEILPFGIAEKRDGDARPAMPAANSGSPFVAPSHFVRVDLGRLDELMRIMGEMVVHRARLEEALGRVSSALPSTDSRELHEITHGFSRELRRLRDGLMHVRMVPIREVFERLPFVVRDLSRENQKKVRLEINGQETELDKYLVERLKDPLLHLIRNAISHGIEEPTERTANGKSDHGTIALRASASGETVLIEVADDGRGIDPKKIVTRARAHGFGVSEHPDAAELLELLCAPGFSTRDEADLGSGRGIGMAAVKNTVLELGGEMELDSKLGHGATFRLRLPLTLAVAEALIVSAGGQRFAMPQSAVQEITTAEEASINHLEQNEIVKYRNGVLPLIRLASVFGLGAERRKEFPVLVVGTGLNAVGILADRILGHREIVVRPMSDPLLKVPGISGATELGDGRAVLILDSVSLTQNARTRQRLAQRQAATSMKVL